MWSGRTTELEFEGHLFRAPAGYEYYLKKNLRGLYETSAGRAACDEPPVPGVVERAGDIKGNKHRKEQKEWIRKQRLFIWRAHACMCFGFSGKREKDTVLLFYRKKHKTVIPCTLNRFLLEYASAEYEYVWVVNDPERIFVPEDLKGKIRLVKAGSPAYFRELATAGIVIYNVGLPSGSLVPKRKTQIWVDTWHGGGAFKAAGYERRENACAAGDRPDDRQAD